MARSREMSATDQGRTEPKSDEPDETLCYEHDETPSIDEETMEIFQEFADCLMDTFQLYKCRKKLVLQGLLRIFSDREQLQVDEQDPEGRTVRLVKPEDLVELLDNLFLSMEDDPQLQKMASERGFRDEESVPIENGRESNKKDPKYWNDRLEKHKQFAESCTKFLNKLEEEGVKCCSSQRRKALLDLCSRTIALNENKPQQDQSQNQEKVPPWVIEMIRRNFRLEEENGQLLKNIDKKELVIKSMKDVQAAYKKDHLNLLHSLTWNVRERKLLQHRNQELLEEGNAFVAELTEIEELNINLQEKVAGLQQKLSFLNKDIDEHVSEKKLLERQLARAEEYAGIDEEFPTKDELRKWRQAYKMNHKLRDIAWGCKEKVDQLNDEVKNKDKLIKELSRLVDVKRKNKKSSWFSKRVDEPEDPWTELKSSNTNRNLTEKTKAIKTDSQPDGGITETQNNEEASMVGSISNPREGQVPRNRSGQEA